MRAAGYKGGETSWDYLVCAYGTSNIGYRKKAAWPEGTKSDCK